MTETTNPASRPLPDYVRTQRGWYRRSLARARFATYTLEILVLFCGTAIAVSATLHVGPVATSLLGAAVTAMTGLRALFGWKESRRARATAYIEINAEIARYERSAHPYDTGDSKLDGDLLQESIIAIVAKEAEAWAARDAAQSRRS